MSPGPRVSSAEGARPTRAGDRAFVLIGLLGASLNLAYAFYRLPPLRACLRLSATPLDNSGIRDSSAEYSLLLGAGGVVPPGARVAVLTASGDRNRDAVLYRFAVALLPGRRIVDASNSLVQGLTTPGGAEYVVLSGPGGHLEDADLLRSDSAGSIWRVRNR